MSKMRVMLLLGLSVLAVGLVIGTAIGFDFSESPSDGLKGTWLLKCYGEPGKLKVPYPGVRCGDITLTTSACVTAEQKIGDYPARDYVITTCAGVNRCSGYWEVDGNKFIAYTIHGEEKRTGGLRCTEAAGPAHLLAQEAQYRHILASAQTYEITNGILIIFSEKGALVFKRRE